MSIIKNWVDVGNDLKRTKDPYSSIIIPATGHRTNRRNRPRKKGIDPCRKLSIISLTCRTGRRINVISISLSNEQRRLEFS
jgi:hypothetical protein